MNQRRALRKNKEISISEMYALKFASLRAALKQEHISLLMLCLYFFFEYIRPQNLYPVLDLLPWGQLALVLSLITAINDPSAKWVNNIENHFFILFIIIIIISGIFAFRPAASFAYWTVFGSWLIVYFLVITVVNTEKRLLLFLLAYCLFNFKMAQHGAVSWAMRGFSFADFGLIGSPGWFRNSGEFAIQMLIFGSLSLAMVISLKNYWGKYKKWIFFACAATGYMAVMGASSRGSQLGLAAIGIWFLLKQKNGFKGLLVLAIFALALYYLLPDEQMERFRQAGDDKESLQRLSYWSYGLNHVIPDNPFIGVGYYNWLPYLNFTVPEGLGPVRTIQGSHNIFIQVTAELGILGLLTFLCLIFYAFINNARTRVMATQINHTLLFNLTYGLDAGMIGYLIAGNFVTVLYYPYFWIQIAMIVMVNNVTRRLFLQSKSQY